MKLAKKEMRRLYEHYTGNCFSCEKCTFFERISENEPGAVEAYVQYIRKTEGREVKVVKS